MIGRTFLQYKIVEAIGSGGMGIVYRAEDTRLHRIVALKFLSAELVRDEKAKVRLLQEARAVSSLQHPNICTIHDICETEDGDAFIVMDYYEGETLKSRLARGPLSARDAVDVTVQIANGLSEAHARGIIHRDIKPANVFITNQGVVKILDFGLAKWAGQTKMTKTGTTVGTFAYMSPEQIRGEELDPRTDIFSLGAIFYEALTGHSPFDANNEPAVVYKTLHVEPPPLESHGVEMASKLEPIVNAMLAKSATKRYRQASEIALALAASEDGKPAQRGRRVRRSAVVAGSALVVLLAVGAWFLLRPGGQAIEPRLAILYFHNVTEPDDPRRLGEVATNLLITDLSESRYLMVISSQRLYDILKKLGKGGLKIIDRDTATAVAREAQATQMLVGSIIEAGGRIELASQLIDVETGNTRSSQKVRGTSTEDIFALIDKLSVDVRQDLDLPMKANTERTVAVADITTHSADAYRYYLRGLENKYEFKWNAARQNFEHSVALDSTFATSWFELCDPWGMGWGTTADRIKLAVRNARKHSARLSETNRRIVEARSKVVENNDVAGAISDLERLANEIPEEKQVYFELYTLNAGRDERMSLEYLKRAIALNPLDKVAYNQFALTAATIGDTLGTAWALDQYEQLAPNDANVHATRGDILGRRCRRKAALQEYEKAVQRDPSFSSSWCKIGYLSLLEGDENRARECWTRALGLSDADLRAAARLYLAVIPLYHGDTERTLSEMRKAIAGDEKEGYDGIYLFAKHWLSGCIFAKKGEWDRAEMVFSMSRDGRRQYDRLRVTQVAWLADIDIARAETYLKLLNADTREYAIGRCAIERASHANQGSVDACETLAGVPFFTTAYTRGRGLVSAGRLTEGIAMLERARDVFPDTDLMLQLPMWQVDVHYYLGQAYEMTGEEDKAVREYTAFLKWWGDADPTFAAQVDDARARLARLGN